MSGNVKVSSAGYQMPEETQLTLDTQHLTPEPHFPILVLALGNDIMGDDGIGLAAARALAEVLPTDGGGVDFAVCAESGLGLLDYLHGYRRALLLDAICTGRHALGMVLEFSHADFPRVTTLPPSSLIPHYSGLPEVFVLAERLGIPFPEEIRVLAVEIEPPEELAEGLSRTAQAALPLLVKRARQVLAEWVQTGAVQ
ncbi:MAG TPA: hydrogenase maturation protease [Chloroflexia bacterium]|nr:hydrogenase maturation protease [Chloroflexia bacterium]